MGPPRIHVVMGKRILISADIEPELGMDDVSGQSDAESAGSARSKGSRKKAAGKKRRSPAKKAAPKRSAQAGRSKRRAGSGTRWCRGCKRSLPLSDFLINQDLHYECKCARDALSKMAVRQKQEEWWAEVQRDDDKLALVISRFLQVTKSSTPGAKAKNKFVIAKYIEKYEAATEVLKDSEGQMMNETEYIDYTMNRKHGPMSASEAAASWQKMVCEPKKHYHDRKGIEGGYRFRVSLRDMVTFRNRFTKSKGVESEGKAVKNPDAAGLQRLKGEVASGGQEDADEFEQMAKSLISSGGGVEEDGFESSFMGANLHNLRVLVEDESEESDDQAPEVSEKDAKSMAGSSTSKGPLAKGSPGGSSSAPPQPVDERQVADECSKAQRLWRKGITSMADNFTELQSQAMEVLREAFPNRMNQHLRNAFGVCDLRSAFGKLVAGNQSDELEMLIAAFKDRREVPSGFLFEQPEVGQLTGESASQQGDSDEAWTTWSEYAEHRLAVGGDAVPSTPGAGAVEAETAVVEDSGESGAAAEKQRSALEAEWQKLVDNPKLARDNGGPEGALRLKIKVAQKANTGQQVGAPERAMNKVVFTPMKEKPDRQAPASNTLKRVPPCRDFEDLRTAEDLLNMADVYEEKDTVDDIREFTKQLLQFKTCARGMYVSWKASVLELEKAIKGWKLANEQSEKDAVKAKARAAKEGTASKRKQGNYIMDIFMEKGVAMQTFDCRVEEWLSKQGAKDILLTPTRWT